MDQLKVFLGHCRKHHFWILCGLAVLLGFGVWYFSTSRLTGEASDRRGKISQQHSQVKQVKSVLNHPNDLSRQRTEANILDSQRSVEAAWERQFNLQGDIFQWSDGLPPLFHAEVRSLRPVETTVPFDPTSDAELVSLDSRQTYQNFIDKELPKLADIIGAKWQISADAVRSTMGMGPGESSFPMAPMAPMLSPSGSTEMGKVEEDTSLVKWNPANQQELLIGRFDWSKQKDSAPTTLQLLYAQEDYWVLTALMEIIRKTNDGYDRLTVPIKAIDFVRLGVTANARAGLVTRPKLSTTGAAGEIPGMPPGSMPPGSMPPGTMPPGSMPPGSMPPGQPLAGQPQPGAMPEGNATTGQPRVMDPADWRYVNDLYQPLTGAQLRESFKSKEPEIAKLAVAKRMPVRLRLFMDHRHLNALLAACANANLTVEVRQIRVNCPAAPVATVATPSLMGPGAIPGGEFSMLSPPSQSSSGPEYGGATDVGGFGMEQPMLGSSGDRKTHEISAFNMPVEIYGIVYIYNPVDRAKFEYKTQDQAAPGGAANQSAASPSGQTPKS